jgi:serine/threonine-protein kinase
MALGSGGEVDDGKMMSSVFGFGGFRLDASRRLLFGADGQPVPLNSRAFDALLCFVERPGELLDKATLLRLVWPTTVVEENNLNQCIWALRRALGETPGEHRFIVTEPGRGYRFVAAVQPLDETASAAPVLSDLTQPVLPAAPRVASDHELRGPVSWPVRLLTLLAVLVLATVVGVVARRPAAPDAALSVVVGRAPSIAVLPFAAMSPGREHEYFADGLSEELANQLSRQAGLKVISRTSSFAFKGRNEDLRRVGRQLGADYLLEGSVRQADGRLRVNAQLIATETGTRLWAETFDRQGGNAITVQDEIARSVSGALQARFSAQR